jgi:hypothetical protein
LAVLFVIVAIFVFYSNEKKREFIWLYDISLPPQAFSTNNFILRRLFAALASGVTKLRPANIVLAGGGMSL